MDFIAAAADFGARTMIARSYIPTEQLSKVREADPALADAIEKLCRATMALRGPAMMMEANGSLTYAAAALAPFVTMQDAFEAAMQAKADSAQAASARSQRKTPECEVKRPNNSPTASVQDIGAAHIVTLRPTRKPIAVIVGRKGKARTHTRD